MIGAFVHTLDRPRRFYGLAIILFGLVSLYSLRSIMIASRNIPVYAERAETWDARALQIEKDVSAGVENINVQAIDGAPVGGIRDFEVKGQGKPGYWINKCAARYYEVEAIDVLTP
jgi:hypothetical protein